MEVVPLRKEFVGRVALHHDHRPLGIDTTASRFTGATIAGLVVGAMGAFVFGAALGHWLNRRRAFGAQAPEGDT
jgi:hypothetical protein